ncbi:MAG TPA: hypothetical protein VJ697_15790, partial [Nitrososphaeraceae archaeon]|nr:hypothetical protein [Nitrososphaeraceae archaeon]
SCSSKNFRKSIERFNTSNLRKFFELQELYYLHLEDEDYKKLTNHRITGASFLVCSKEDLEKIGLLYGPILELHHLKTIITDGKV